MAIPDERGANDPDDDAPIGEVPVGLDADLYPRHLENLRADEKFGEAVLSFRDAEGRDQEIPIDEVEATEQEQGSNRTKITLRNGAIVVVTGAVIAGAIAAIRYRRRHRQQP
jgi:hypothetical protein